METEERAEEELLPYPFGSPRDILTAFFKQKNIIFVTFLVTFLGVAGWIYSQDTLYEASSTLVLKFGREHIFRPEVGQVDQIVQFDQNAAVESELKILKSKDLVRRVVQAIGVETLYPDFLKSTREVQPHHIEGATSKFLGNLEAAGTKGTNLIEITFLHEQPEIAAQALNHLVETLKEKHLQVFSDPKASFLISRLQDYEKDLKNAERDLQAFKLEHDLSSPLDAQQARLLDQQVQLDTNYKTIKHQLQGLASKVSSVESQMKDIPEYVPISTTEGEGILAKARADLFDLRRREQALLTKYTAMSAPVKNLQKEIALVEQFVSEQEKGERDKRVTSGKNPIFQKLEIERFEALSDLKTFKASSEVIEKQIEDLDQRLSRLDLLNKELVELERKRRTAEENYKLYVQKVEEAKVSEEMDHLKMSNIGVIQMAEVPRKPAGRPLSFLLLVGAIFGTIVGVGLGFVSEYFHGGYTRPDQAAEDLGLPVLASFSHKG